MNPILSVKFFATEAGSEPVREWLKGLSAQDRKTIGEDIKTVQYGWPLGMPLVDHLEGDIWEVRVKRKRSIIRVIHNPYGPCQTIPTL
ncbi:type II toxin-antitoxin system RelE/ParE family toxin [Methylomonas paludis]|uniref:type II toxin-antitoxin system RelE/ParE family toxin n=1 Tax=Methylomonas paludis TaxID=1173101 RepID=UPI001FE4BF70|nr:type II toxin-antitoxin system RelE/ParE family toxin [Methylomonas paludis]